MIFKLNINEMRTTDDESEELFTVDKLFSTIHA